MFITTFHCHNHFICSHLIEVVIILGIMVLIFYSIAHTTDISGMMFEEQ